MSKEKSLRNGPILAKIENKNRGKMTQIELATDKKNFFYEHRDKSFDLNKLKLQLKKCAEIELLFKHFPASKRLENV